MRANQDKHAWPLQLLFFEAFVRRRRGVVFCICRLTWYFGFSLSLGLCSPQNQNPNIPSESTTIRSTTRLVQVNVVVNDPKDNPVEDLTIADFQILDNGVPQQLRFFTAEKSRAPVTKRVALPPDVISNDQQRSVMHDTITVILLDSANTQFSDLAFARQQVIRFLSQLRPTDCVGIYLLGHDLRILHDFTNDSASLVSKILNYRIPLLDIRPPGGNTVSLTLAAFQAIAYHLSGLSGRKNLIWVSSGFPLVENPKSLNATNRGAALQRVAFSLNQADIAVYPVDARGLMVNAPINNTALLTMMQIAHDTGGKAFVEFNDVQGAIRKVIDSSRMSYSLGFYPTSSAGDKKFHSLSIRVNRRGASVHCRRGYFDSTGESTPENSIRAVLANSLEATGLGVMARVQLAETGKLIVDVRVEPSAIVTEERDGKRVAILDFGLAPMDQRGVSYLGALDPITLRLDAADYDRFLRGGVRYHHTMEFDRRASILRIVVRDRLSGAIGSVTIPASKFRKSQS
jgi:VWFA-related protein